MMDTIRMNSIYGNVVLGGAEAHIKGGQISLWNGEVKTFGDGKLSDFNTWCAEQISGAASPVSIVIDMLKDAERLGYRLTSPKGGELPLSSYYRLLERV